MRNVPGGILLEVKMVQWEGAQECVPLKPMKDVGFIHAHINDLTIIKQLFQMTPRSPAKRFLFIHFSTKYSCELFFVFFIK